MKFLFGCPAAAILCAVFSGCSIMAPPTQIVAINVQPPDATVVANGVRYQGAPLFIEVARDRDLLLTFQRPDYENFKMVVGHHLSSTGRLDAIGSFLIVPFLGLFSGGAWVLDENNLNVTMRLLPESNQSKEKALAEAARKALAVTTDAPVVAAPAASKAPVKAADLAKPLEAVAQAEDAKARAERTAALAERARTEAALAEKRAVEAKAAEAEAAVKAQAETAKLEARKPVVKAPEVKPLEVKAPEAKAPGAETAPVNGTTGK